MKNRDIAHKFFYDLNGSFDRNSMTVSYAYSKYYSYSTVIGQIAETITGGCVCIISATTFSVTTAHHIAELRQACPFDVMRLPQTRGDDNFNNATNTCIETLEYYATSKLSLKDNREAFTRYFNMLENTLNLSIFKNDFERIITALDTYRDIYNTINNPEKLALLKAKDKEVAKRKQAKLKIELESILNTHSYIDIVKMAYHPQSACAKELKNRLKAHLNPNCRYSFVAFEGEHVITSQGIRVSKKEAIVLLRLWQTGRLKHGQTISHYTVLEVMPTYIKIGCHVIPIENIEALCAEIELQKAA